MNILLISVHPVLEYDEICLFESMHHQLFSLGFYFRRAEAETLRPNLAEHEWHRQMRTSFIETGCASHIPKFMYKVSQSFVANFDVVIVHHNWEFILNNAPELKGVPVIWRGIGQEPAAVEAVVPTLREMGVKIVRWSPAESRMPGYAGEDAVIRASKDELVYGDWLGSDRSVVSFMNNAADRRDAVSLDFFYQALDGIPFKLFGLGNNGCVGWAGLATYDEQLALMRDNLVFFSTGTMPASYTLSFVEAWLAGIPVVHLGRSAHERLGFRIFEVDELISHGHDGFVVEDAAVTRELLRELIEGRADLPNLSRSARQKASAVFGRDTGARGWSDLFARL